MIEETKRAMNRGILTHASLASSVGYREVITYIENGGGEKEELISSIAKSTRQLVSKQRKWFRKRFPDNSRYMIDRNAYMDLKNLGWVAVT